MPVMDASGVARRGFGPWASWASALLPVGSSPDVAPSELERMDGVLLFGLGVRPSSLDFVPVGGGGVLEFFSGLFPTFFQIFFFFFSCISIACFAIRT